MGSGLISSDFVGSLQDLPATEAKVAAVAARSKASAEKFAQSFGIPNVYEGYEALAADPEVDVIYIGTVARTHADCVRLALAAGKPVLVEKPIALCEEEAAALVAEVLLVVVVRAVAAGSLAEHLCKCTWIFHLSATSWNVCSVQHWSGRWIHHKGQWCIEIIEY